MLRIDPKWGETSQSLLERAISAEDPHLRRRFLALHFVACGDCGVAAAEKVGRCRAQVATWVKKFNASGPQALVSNWQGHPGKALSEEEFSRLAAVVSRPPREAGLLGATEAMRIWRGGVVETMVHSMPKPASTPALVS